MEHTFFSNNVQEIHTTPQGVITFSNNTIQEFEEGENIKEIHPFFESLAPQFEEPGNKNLAFPCVQLTFENKECICYITIKKERGDVAILLFDYTRHYQHLHEATQEKKQAMLNEQAFELTSKHQEEQKAYFEYIRDRIDAKIINELESVVKTLTQLKKTSLTEEQQELIGAIEQHIGVLHTKAIEVRNGLTSDSN